MGLTMQFASVVLIATAVAALPQHRSAKIAPELRGHTQDKKQKALSNVVLTLYECVDLRLPKCEKALISTTSRDDGSFTLREKGIKPGVYSLMAELPPFLRKMKIPVDIPNDNGKSFDFVMQVDVRTAGRLEGLSGEDAKEVYAAAKVKKDDAVAALAAEVMKDNGLDSTNFLATSDKNKTLELDELTTRNAKMIADVDARATEGIRNAMSKANEEDQRVLDAGNKANQNQQTAQQSHTRIATVEDTVSKIDQYQPITQAEIRFRAGQSALSKNAKDALDQMATSLKNQKGYIVEVQGFSPGNGTMAIENSREMVQMVVRYLVLNHEIPVYRIYTVGMGNAPIQAEDGKIHRQKGGKVEISLLKNGLTDLDSTEHQHERTSDTSTTPRATPTPTPPNL